MADVYIREECKNCRFCEEKTLHCSVLDLKWAWYELLMTLPVFHRCARVPEVCNQYEFKEEIL